MNDEQLIQQPDFKELLQMSEDCRTTAATLRKRMRGKYKTDEGMKVICPKCKDVQMDSIFPGVYWCCTCGKYLL